MACSSSTLMDLIRPPKAVSGNGQITSPQRLHSNGIETSTVSNLTKELKESDVLSTEGKSENLIPVWLDLEEDRFAFCLKHILLCKSAPYLTAFRDTDSCVDYITNMAETERKVVLMISADTIQSLNTLVQLCDTLAQIESIYIACWNTTTDETFFEMTSKMRGVCNSIDSLCDQLEQVPNLQRRRLGEQRGVTRDDFTPCIIRRATDSAIVTNTTTNLVQSSEEPSTIAKRQEADFMYSYFLREILNGIPSTEDEMLDFCRRKFADEEETQLFIQEFHDYYDPGMAVFWYTRDTFLYRMLNKALREQDIDTLYAIRFFIQQLQLQLKDLHEEQPNSLHDSLDSYEKSEVETEVKEEHNHLTADPTKDIVYRGQLMNNEEFEKKIRHNVGGFFSVCSFFSTTLQKALATVYAGDGSQADRTQSVLFQIVIDKSVNKFPYANISNQSAFDEAENEILFTMGVVFRILSVERDSQQEIWDVKLQLTDEEDVELRKLLENMRKGIFPSDLPPLHSLGKLMLRMGKLKEAEHYYQLLVDSNDLTPDTLPYHCISLGELGLAYREMGQIERAAELLENSLSIALEHIDPRDPLLAPLLNNLGTIYQDQGNYERALLYLNMAVQNELSAPGPDQYKIAVCYGNVGSIYHKQRDYARALDTHEKSLAIFREILPSNHPVLAVCCNNISLVLSSQNNYERAVEYLHRALQIQLMSLPSSHPHLTRTYDNLSMAYYRQNNLEEALKYLKISYEMTKGYLPTIPSTEPSDSQWLSVLERLSHQTEEENANLEHSVKAHLYSAEKTN